MILAGDIGGTKTNIALFESSGSKVGAIVRQQTFSSPAYHSLEAILTEFIGGADLSLTGACFGVAAPVINRRARTPNLDWHVSATSLANLLKLDRVGVINDLEATANGIPILTDAQLLTLNQGNPKACGHRALIAAGTGLGMAGIFHRDGVYYPIASEGGHIDFAPRSPIEVELLRYLLEQHPEHVSYERVVSGPGLFNIYSFLRDRGYGEEPDWLAEQIKTVGKAPAVASAALEHKSDLAVRALDLCVSIYGAIAGNLALLLLPTGGLYIGGGIAPKIREKLVDGTFMEAFVGKGRFADVMQTIPVHVILEEKTALFGAARAALSSE